MKHFATNIGGGTEYISVCRKKHKVGEPNQKWYKNTDSIFYHKTCDLCEFDSGGMHMRLAYFYEHELLTT